MILSFNFKAPAKQPDFYKWKKAICTKEGYGTKHKFICLFKALQRRRNYMVLEFWRERLANKSI